MKSVQWANAVGHSLRICVAINIKYDSLCAVETEETQLQMLLLLLLSLLGYDWAATYQIFLAGNWPSCLGHILAAFGQALNELHLLAGNTPYFA